MPIYEFKCDKCDRLVEHLLTSKEAKITTVLECGKCGGAMKKIISAPNHTIKGFSYKNLYGLKGNKNGKKEDKPKQ
jgi:putative FmdB family regulatory protein